MFRRTRCARPASAATIGRRKGNRPRSDAQRRAHGCKAWRIVAQGAPCNTVRAFRECEMRLDWGVIRGLIAYSAVILLFVVLIASVSGNFLLAVLVSLGVGLAIPVSFAVVWVVMLL